MSSTDAGSNATLSVDFSKILQNITIWDLIILVTVAACIYVILINESDPKQIFHIVLMVVLYALALRIIVNKLTCNQNILQEDLTRTITWSSAFISYLAMRYTLIAVQDEEYVRATIEGIIAFLFLFVFMKGLMGKLKVS